MCFIPTSITPNTTETRLSVIETRLSHIEKHYATKADLYAVKDELKTWMIGQTVAIIGIIAALFRLMG